MIEIAVIVANEHAFKLFSGHSFVDYNGQTKIKDAEYCLCSILFDIFLFSSFKAVVNKISDTRSVDYPKDCETKFFRIDSSIYISERSRIQINVHPHIIVTDRVSSGYTNKSWCSMSFQKDIDSTMRVLCIGV